MPGTSSYSSGLLRRPSEYAWISSATLRIPHSLFLRSTKDTTFKCVVDNSKINIGLDENSYVCKTYEFRKDVGNEVETSYIHFSRWKEY